MTRVSVVTPTWNRRHLLLDLCVPSVQVQTWGPVEHVVVSDGPDPELADLLPPDVVYLQLPDHPAGDVDYGSRARNHGLAHATGDVIAYLDDDNMFRAHHLELLVPALQGVDWAFSRMLRHPKGDEIGSTPPEYGSVDTSLIAHHKGLPERCGMWPLPGEIEGDKHAPDWGVVKRWLDKGATWAHVPVVTVDYYFSR